MAAPDDWTEQDGALVRELRFGDFRSAIDFVNRLAEVAETENHHPDLEIHYNRVVVRWSTHSAGGITGRDHELAKKTSALL